MKMRRKKKKKKKTGGGVVVVGVWDGVGDGEVGGGGE